MNADTTGRYSFGLRQVYASYLSDYLEACRLRGVDVGALALYESDLSEFVTFVVDLAEQEQAPVSRANVRAWLSNLRALGYSQTTISRKAIMARALMSHAVGKQENPFQGVRLPSSRPESRPVLTVEQVRELIESPDDSTLGLRDRAVLALLYSSGLRLSEFSALDVRQLDLRRRQLKRWNGELAFFGQTTANHLVRYLQEAHPRLRGVSHEQALFLSRLGTRLSAQSIRLLVEKRAAALGFAATPQSLRDSCAAHLRAGGMRAGAVRDLLGISLQGITN